MFKKFLEKCFFGSQTCCYGNIPEHDLGVSDRERLWFLVHCRSRNVHQQFFYCSVYVSANLFNAIF